MNGRDLRKIRTEVLRLTQKELGLALGLSTLRICQLEQERTIHLRTQLALNWLVLQHKRQINRKRAFKRTIKNRRLETKAA